MSLFVWYFGTRRRYPDVAHHTILLGPRYRELLRDIFERKVLAADFSLYLHRPTATDPSLAPAGLRRLLRAVAGAAPGQRHRLGAPRPRPTAAHRAPPGRDRAAGPEQEVVTSRMLTPQDFQDRLLVVPGRRLRAGAGPDPERLVPAPQPERGGRPALSGRRRHPSRAGLPGVLSSARVLDMVVPDAAELA